MWIRASIVAMATATAVPASAQFIGGTSPMDLNTVQSATLRAHIDNLSLRKLSGRGGSASQRVGPAPTILTSAFYAPARHAGPATDASRLRYVSTAATRQAATAGLIARTRRVNPKATDALAAEMRRVDFFKTYADAVRDDGIRADNLADVTVSYIAILWMIANQKLDFDNPAAMRAAAAQTASVLSQSRALASPTTRAAAAEEMKLLFVTTLGGLQSARRDRTLPALSAAVNSSFQRETGENLRTIRLTAAGFGR